MHGLSVRCREPRKVHLFNEYGHAVCGARGRTVNYDDNVSWERLPELRCARCVRYCRSPGAWFMVTMMNAFRRAKGVE